jgi:disulfide bond formation protein DsbB
MAGASIVLTLWLDLNPCHLCIFQRLLFMILALIGIAAAWGAGAEGSGLAGRLIGALALPTAALGAATAAYQGWLQAQPPGEASCIAGTPGLIERWVEWLGQRVPELFMATGFCEEEGLILVGLSLAHWALIGFLICLAAAIWALLQGRRVTDGRGRDGNP